MKPYYENENGRLYHGDCLEIIPELEKVDCVITSPPYNMNLRLSNNKYCKRKPNKKEFSTKYQNFEDNMSMDEYYNFSVKLIKNLFKITDLIFFNIQIITGNKVALFKLIGEFSEQIKEIIIWDKKTAQPAMNCGVLNSQYELIIIFHKTDSIRRSFSGRNFGKSGLSNIWGISSGSKKTNQHGAVFPEELVSKIIHNFTDPGYKILDPFFGTGTTGLVCEKLDRKFIGIELSEQYCEIAAKRIEAENKQLKLF